MANKKLTLSVDAEIIEAAKQYASQQGHSLSVLVENLLLSLTSSRTTRKKSKLKLSPELEKIRGLVKIPVGFDTKTTKLKRLEKKYL